MAAVRDCGIELVHHPPYSSSNYVLFPNTKGHLAEKQYRIDDEVISAVEDFFWRSGWELLYHGDRIAATPMPGWSVWTAGENYDEK